MRWSKPSSRDAKPSVKRGYALDAEEEMRVALGLRKR
jgi:hypothetical protein